MGCRVVPTLNMDYINSVLTSDEMWPRISESHQDINTFYQNPKPGDIYLMALEDEKPVGFYYLHNIMCGVMAIHAHILKEHRNCSKDVSKCILAWCEENLPQTINVLAAHIPAIFKDVQAHTEKMGFQHAGKYPGGSFKGEWVDIDIFILPRERWKQWQSV